MDIATWDTIFGLCIGLGLAASCGFRVFVPLLVVSVAAKSGHLVLSESFAWLESWPAIIGFGAATALEVSAYYVPWVDNLLDTISAPAAVVAGTIATAACVADMDPMLQWAVGIIAGGSVAGAVNFGSSSVRATSTLTTAGLGNFGVATAELAISSVLSVISILVPVLAAVLVIVAITLVARLVLRRWNRPTSMSAV